MLWFIVAVLFGIAPMDTKEITAVAWKLPRSTSRLPVSIWRRLEKEGCCPSHASQSDLIREL